MFKRIVVATDRIATPDAPVLSAVDLARQKGSRLFLLHVLESASTENRRQVRHFMTGEALEADPAYEADVRQALQKTYADRLGGIDHEIAVATGFPWEMILYSAKAVESDLIVLGPHSSRAEEKGVARTAGRVGSTVENVITRETCPVMVVNRPATAKQLAFRRILVPIDFSRACECAICFAARLAALHDSQMVIMHMLPVPPYPKYTHADYAADADAALKRLIALTAPYLDDIIHQYHVCAGAMPHTEILKGADEFKVDAIVMGSHTTETAGKWYPGSAVERASYRSACPVMVINDPDVLVHWEGASVLPRNADPDRLIHLFTGRVAR